MTIEVGFQFSIRRTIIQLGTGHRIITEGSFVGRLFSRTRRLIRVCIVCLNYRKLRVNETVFKKKVREKSRKCHNHKPQPFPDPKRKRKPTNPNKHKSNKRTKSTNISSLFPKRGNRNTKRTKKHKNKMTHGKTYSKSPCRINTKQQRVRLTPGSPP